MHVKRLHSLVSKIAYDPESKDSFFEAINEWSKKENSPITQRIATLSEQFTETCIDAYALIFFPKAESEKIGPIKRTYYLTAMTTQLPFGRWDYDPKKREIIRGNELQRNALILMGIDPLVHEYLHAYQHLLYDSLKKTKEKVHHPIPASIIEPPLLSFLTTPPSYDYMHFFEKRVIRKIKVNS